MGSIWIVLLLIGLASADCDLNGLCLRLRSISKQNTLLCNADNMCVHPEQPDCFKDTATPNEFTCESVFFFDKNFESIAHLTSYLLLFKFKQATLLIALSSKRWLLPLLDVTNIFLISEILSWNNVHLTNLPTNFQRILSHKRNQLKTNQF